MCRFFFYQVSLHIYTFFLYITIFVIKLVFLISRESRWTERKANLHKMSARTLEIKHLYFSECLKQKNEKQVNHITLDF